jgi:hypothetical protein
MMGRPSSLNHTTIVNESLIKHDGEAVVNEELKKYGPNFRMGFESWCPGERREELTVVGMTIG